MKKIILLLIALFIATATISSAFAATFIDGMEDIPLMQGLQQVKSENIAFGNEESRFIEVYLSGKVSFQAVEKFYMNTLPQLGWSFEEKKQESLVFYRDNDMIEIVKEKNKPLLVRITLKSRG